MNRVFAFVAALLVISCMALPGFADEAAQYVESLNLRRKSAGLQAVVLDEALSRACTAHAKYLAVNCEEHTKRGKAMSIEEKDLPGYSKEGAAAAAKAFVHLREPLDALNFTLARASTRHAVLMPHLKRIGVGFATGGPQGFVTVLDKDSGLKGKLTEIFVYPGEGQTDVPLQMEVDNPNPVPQDPDGSAGYPVSVFFPQGTGIKDVSATMKDSAGVVVEVWLSSPDTHPKDMPWPSSILVIARDKLQPKTPYTVTVTGKVGGKPWKRAWTFTTGEK